MVAMSVAWVSEWLLCSCKVVARQKAQIKALHMCDYIFIHEVFL